MYCDGVVIDGLGNLPFTTKRVDAHDGQVWLGVGVSAQVQIHHLLNDNILGLNSL